MRFLRSVLLVGLALLLSSSLAIADRFLDSIDHNEKQILNDLHNGQIIEAKPFGENGNMGSLWKVKVQHEGRVRDAVFKPRPFGDRDGWARTPMEAAVYKLDRILGTGFVPPVAYRRGLNLAGNHFAEGAMVLWVENAHGIADIPEHEWNPKREVFSSDLRVVQAISRDADNQNIHNILRAKSWKGDGKYQLIKVDNEASMREGAYVNLEHTLPTWGEVTRFNKKTFQKLKTLNFADLKMDVGEFMSDSEIHQWLSTRDTIVKHIESQVKVRGDVFFAESEVGFNAKKRVGKTASRSFRGKFDGKMKDKGVRVRYLPSGDPRLRGAQGRTVLTPKGIKVYLVKQPAKATLVEELVHVNQLRSMATRAGGFGPLHQALSAETNFAKLAPHSMEAYAKGRVALTQRGRGKVQSKAERRTYLRALERAGVTRGAQTMWRDKTPARAAAPPKARAPARVR